MPTLEAADLLDKNTEIHCISMFNYSQETRWAAVRHPDGIPGKI